MQKNSVGTYFFAGLRDADIFETIDYLIRIGWHLSAQIVR